MQYDFYMGLAQRNAKAHAALQAAQAELSAAQAEQNAAFMALKINFGINSAVNVIDLQSAAESDYIAVPTDADPVGKKTATVTFKYDPTKPPGLPGDIPGASGALAEGSGVPGESDDPRSLTDEFADDGRASLKSATLLRPEPPLFAGETIHLTDDRFPNKFRTGSTFCGEVAPSEYVTADSARVTCTRCIRRYSERAQKPLTGESAEPRSLTDESADDCRQPQVDTTSTTGVLAVASDSLICGYCEARISRDEWPAHCCVPSSASGF